MSDHHVEAGHQLPTGHMCYCQKPWLHHSEAAAPYDVNHRLFVWQKSQKVGVPLQGGVMLHGWHLSRHHCFQLAPQLDNRGWEDNRMCWYSSSECDDSLSQHGNAIGSADNRGWEDNRMCWYSSSECDDSLSQHGNATGSADNRGWQDNRMCWYSSSERDDSLSQHGNAIGSADNRGWEDNRMCWYSSSECGDSLSKHGNAIGSADNKGWEDNSMCWYSLSECDDSLSQHGNTLGSANYIILWDFCGFLECHFYVTEKHKTISTSSLTAIFLFTGQTTMIWQQRPCQKQKLMGHQCSPQQLQVI